jgi:acetyltransferase-like isoleucine patch superfamily enzyme
LSFQCAEEGISAMIEPGSRVSSGFEDNKQWSFLKRVRFGLRYLVLKHLWGIDIHPSARIELTAYIDRTWPRGVHIGPNSYVGDEAAVLTHDQTRGVFLHTTIGDRCHVGPRAIVLPGVTVGNDCILMPGTLITKDVPAGSIAIGNPATIRPRAPDR